MKKINWQTIETLLTILIVLVFILELKSDRVETVSTPAGDYECRGTIIKACSGSQAVKDYLGLWTSRE